jgi:hypothetical protein
MPSDEPADAPALSEKQEAEKNALLLASRSGKLDTTQEKVAWLLNHYPITRDSDTALVIHFWSTFEPELIDGRAIRFSSLYQATKVTSITRARAKIQNTYRLFLATPDVRKTRGKLAESERDKAVEQRLDYPLTAVYADESGKDQRELIVGSVWIVHPPEQPALFRRIESWKQEHSFDREFHFADINRSNVDHYCSFADFIAQNSAVLGFKAVSVERRGLGHPDAALARLYYLLLTNGVEHDDQSGRAPLPRLLSVWKDMEEINRDKLFLAELRDKLKQAAATRFHGKLGIDELETADSTGDPFVQLADLFTSSLNRIVNSTRQNEHPKDRFADYFLQRIGMSNENQRELREGDDVFHIRL